MPKRIRLAIIGLGRLWETRHKPALSQLRDRFEVVCVYDQVFRRAALEALQIGCRTSESLVEMISSPEVDAVAVLTPQWFGWHPVDLALEHRKPVYCALHPAAHATDLRRTAEVVQRTGVAFVPELPRRVYPATLRLQELLKTHLGQPRLIMGQSRLNGYDRYGEPGPATQLAQTALVIDPGGNLLDWCRFIFQAEPTRITRTEATVLPGIESAWGPDYELLALRFPQGGVSQLCISRYHQANWGEARKFLPIPGYQVYAEHGAAWLEMPDRIVWTDKNGGIHDERLIIQPSVGERLLDQFRLQVLGEATTAPGIADALFIAETVEQLRSRSQESS